MVSLSSSITAALLLPSFAAASTLRQAVAPSSSSSSVLPVRKLQSANDGELKLHEATFITSHNAHATLAVSEGFWEPLGANQDDTIFDQLQTDGVRALMLDIELNEAEYAEEPLRLTHGSSSFMTLDYGGFRTTMGTNLVPFLEENEDAIISFFIETKGDFNSRSVVLEQLQSILSTLTVKGTPLKEMTFKYNDELWANHDDWPTLNEIRESGQRLFFFVDKTQLIDEEFGFMYNQEVLKESDWEQIDIDACDERFEFDADKVSLPDNSIWTRLFLMNHFCCGSGPDSKGDTVGEGLIGGGKNGWGRLYPRISHCVTNNGGQKPNFIALDWVSQSKEALDLVQYLMFGRMFGSKLGTGQPCTEDSHCATSSCNVVIGFCQCQECPADSVDECLGCGLEQICSIGGQALNVCQKGGESETVQSNPPSSLLTNGTESPSLSPISQANSETISPTQNPIVDQTSSFYCGKDYWEATSGCNNAVKCPGGNDDCPDGETCFAGVDCTLPPTSKPSYTPSYAPSLSPKPTTSPVSLTEIWPSTPSGLNANANSDYCGLSRADAQNNCQTALPCPGAGADGNNRCAILLGDEYSCWSSIMCGGSGFNQAPAPTAVGENPFNPNSTPAPAGSWLSNLGITKSPSVSPTTKPTKSPFDFENKRYCGGNYTTARDNCYTTATPCPGGKDDCSEGENCFSGITCTAPPTAVPTSSPTPKTITAVYPPSESATNPSPIADIWNPGRTAAPFDSDLYEGRYSSASTISLWIAQTLLVVIGAAGLLMI